MTLIADAEHDLKKSLMVLALAISQLLMKVDLSSHKITRLTIKY